MYPTNVISLLKTGYVFYHKVAFLQSNFESWNMCQKCCILNRHTDPSAKSVQYLNLLNTLIFPKIFSTGDILTLVDHTLIDHTACSSCFTKLASNPLQKWNQNVESGILLSSFPDTSDGQMSGIWVRQFLDWVTPPFEMS